MQGRSAAMVHRRSSGEVRPYVRSSKPRFNWTVELKLLFEEAMALLGGTRKATPKQIRELMKCPHIQLSHIKSRLQMCRIRLEEKERRPGTNSSEEVQRKRRADSNDANNGDEQSVVVDESEPNNAAAAAAAAALSLSMPSSSLEYEYSQSHFFYPSPQSLQPPSKRLRLDQVNPSASSWQSPQRICDAGAIKFQFCFDYFGPSQVYGGVMPVLSNTDIFREEQSEAPYNVEEVKEEEEELQLSLSLPKPCRAKMINLDLSMSFPES